MDADNNKPFHPAVLIVAGMMMGCSNGVLDYMQWLQANAESLLVTSYTVSVLLYLSYLAVSDRFFWASRKTEEKAPPLTVTTPTTPDDDSSAVVEPEPALTEEQPFDLSGAYKLISNDGFEEFLAVQGVPWALRRAANQARPVHRITHRASQLTIKIEGIIESQTTYVIGGPPVETNVRGRIFEDSVAYLLPSPDGGQRLAGICVSKRAITEEYDVTVVRILSDDKQQITMTSTAFFRDERESVKSVQLFQRIE